MRRIPLLLALALGLAAASPARAQGAIMLERPADEPPVPRLRIGGEFGGGVGYGATDGGTLAGFGHVGAQITRELGVFYQGALAGYGFGAGNDYDKFLAWQNSVMVDLTVRNVAQLGIGGGLDLGRFVWCEDRSGACTQVDGPEVHPSMSMRIAFLVAFPRHNARWGIPFALHAHIMLWDHRPQSHLMLTIGFSRY